MIPAPSFIPNISRYQKYSEPQKGSSTKFFGTVFEGAILFEGSKNNDAQMAEKPQKNGIEKRIVYDVEHRYSNVVEKGKMATALNVSSA